MWVAEGVAPGFVEALPGTAAPATHDRLALPADSGTVESSTFAAAPAAVEALRESNRDPSRAESCTDSYCWTSLDCSRLGKRRHGTTGEADCTTSDGRPGKVAMHKPAGCTRFLYDIYHMDVMAAKAAVTAAATAAAADIYSSIFS